MKWFRFYSESVYCRKVQELPAPLFRFWVNVLGLANAEEPRGIIPSPTNVAFALRLPERTVEKMMGQLMAAGLVDHEGSEHVPHNWKKWQRASDDAAERMANKRRTSSEDVPPRLDKTREDSEQKQNQNRTEQRLGAAASRIFELYEQTIGTIDPHIAEELKQAETEFSVECLEHTAAEVSEQNKRSWKYWHAILKRHKTEGCYGPKTVGQGRDGRGAKQGAGEGPDLEEAREFIRKRDEARASRKGAV